MASNKTQWHNKCRGRTQGKIQRQNSNNETQRKKKTLTEIKNPQHKSKHANGGAKMQKMQNSKSKRTNEKKHTCFIQTFRVYKECWNVMP